MKIFFARRKALTRSILIGEERGDRKANETLADREFRWRPYRVEYTGSLLTSEVKRHRAWLVLGWGTAWEHPQVLPAFLHLSISPVVWRIAAVAVAGRRTVDAKP